MNLWDLTNNINNIWGFECVPIGIDDLTPDVPDPLVNVSEVAYPKWGRLVVQTCWDQMASWNL